MHILKTKKYEKVEKSFFFNLLDFLDFPGIFWNFRGSILALNSTILGSKIHLKSLMLVNLAPKTAWKRIVNLRNYRLTLEVYRTINRAVRRNKVVSIE